MESQEQKAPEAQAESVPPQGEPVAQQQQEEAKPDKEIQLGDVGKLDLDISNGVAMVSISAAVPGQVGLEGGAYVKCDAKQLVSKLFDVLEKKSPAGAIPIEEAVKAIILKAVESIG